MSFTADYFKEAVDILGKLDQSSVEETAELLADLRERSGRLFLLGVGGGAGHASHAVCDFRKIAQIEAYAPSDNISELTARVNDEGWDTCYANWLRGSHLNEADMIFTKFRRVTGSVISLEPLGNSRPTQSRNSGVSASCGGSLQDC